jgi:hypothetical protein
LISGRRSTFLRRAAVVFITAWAVRSLVVTGDAALNEHLTSTLLSSPWVTQARSGDGFEQSLIQIRQTLPGHDSVLVVWSNPPDYYYAYFWSTFWLFPRRVTVATSVEGSQVDAADAIVVVRRPSEQSPAFQGMRLVATYSHPDYVVMAYERDG